MQYEEVIQFHGHSCPGLAIGYRVASLAVKELQFERDIDEDLVAIVENNSCAVDAVQMVAGCTFGKGNLLFHDYGKQVYTFFKRSAGESLRISVNWDPPEEDAETREGWQKYMAGDRSPEVLELVHARKAAKTTAVLTADDNDLFTMSRPKIELPPRAQIYPTLTCDRCGEKVMAPKTEKKGKKTLCIPCSNA